MTRKSRCFLKAFAIKNGITISLKPKVIVPYIVKKVLILARKGFHRRVISKCTHISNGSVEQIISTEPGLVEKRRRYKQESKRRKYKIQILRALQHNPHAIKQEIKNSCYAAFYWLYIHEKDWLNNTLPNPIKPNIHL